MYRTVLFVVAVFLFKASEAQDQLYKRREGEPLEIRVRFPVNPTICTWSNDRGPIFPDEKMYEMKVDNGECVLTILKVNFEMDNGKLVCAISNTDRQTMEIMVLIPPTEQYLEFSDGTRIDGNVVNADEHLADGANELELNCVVDGGSPNASIQWQLMGIDQPPTSVRSVESGKKGFMKFISTYKVEFGNSPVQYSTHLLNKEYEKNVTCKILQDAYEGGMKTIDVVVAKKYKTEHVILEMEGDIIDGKQRLICKADGYPNPTIEFQTADGKEIISEGGQYSHTALIDTEGNYVCLAKNELNQMYVKSNELKVDFKEPEPKEEAEQASANIGVAVGASLGGIFLVIIVVAISVFLYRREKLCFAKQSSKSSTHDAESGKTNDGQIPPDESYENQNLKADEEKGDIEKGDQNENMKPKEIVYAQLDLTQTNGNNTKKSKPETAKTEYARIQFQPKENQV